jgi:hypothetical protein
LEKLEGFFLIQIRLSFVCLECFFVFCLLNVFDLKVSELIPIALKEEMKPSANYFKGELDRILASGNTKSISIFSPLLNKISLLFLMRDVHSFSMFVII